MTHIFLYGPSGTGKSTIGEILAQKLHLPFVDIDRVMELNAGLTNSQIMEQRGEAAFRDLETAALREVVDHASSKATSGDKVIALGGGALLRDENRLFVENKGSVILLTAGLKTLLERLNEDPNKRPLLTGDLKAKLSMLLEKRADHYNSFPLKVDVDGKKPEQIAHQIQLMVGRHHLSAMGEYDVMVDQVSNLTNFPMHNPIIVTDENVAKFHLQKLESILQASACEPKSVVVPAGEEHKKLETISYLWKSF